MILQELSWTNYLAGIAILLGIYYAGVGILYFRKEIKNLLLFSRRKMAENNTGSVASEAAFEDLEHVAKQITGILEKAGKGANKPELLSELKQVFANFSGLHIPAYKAAVFNHIIHEAKEKCGVGISVQELEG